MISQRNGVISHPIQRIHLHAPVEEVEVRRPLTEIPRIYQQHILATHLLRARYLFYHCHARRVAASAVAPCFHLRMRIIRMQNHQLRCLLPAAPKPQRQRTDQ